MRSQRLNLVLTLVACLVLSGSSALAQSKKTTREAEKLTAAGATAKRGIDAALGKLEEILVQYNAIIDGSAERKPAFKTLQG